MIRPLQRPRNSRREAEAVLRNMIIDELVAQLNSERQQILAAARLAAETAAEAAEEAEELAEFPILFYCLRCSHWDVCYPDFWQGCCQSGRWVAAVTIPPLDYWQDRRLLASWWIDVIREAADVAAAALAETSEAQLRELANAALGIAA